MAANFRSLQQIYAENCKITVFIVSPMMYDDVNKQQQ